MKHLRKNVVFLNEQNIVPVRNTLKCKIYVAKISFS